MGRRSLLRSLARRFGYDLRRRGDLIQQDDPFVAQAALLAGRSVAQIVDVGASVGDTVARYATLFPQARIDAFEPVPASFDRLQARYEGHALIRPVPGALGREPGQLALNVYPRADTTSAHPFTPAAARWMPADMLGAPERITVSVDTLDAYVQREGIDHLGVLKLDVQGHEVAILEGAADLLSRAAIDVVFAEVSFVPAYDAPLAHDVSAFLHSRDYALFRFYELVYAPSGQLLWGDALYLSPGMAASLPDREKAFRQNKTMR